MKSSNNDLILVIDALNLFTRHFVAHPARGSNGEHVGGIVGFMYAIADFSERFKPSQIVVVWEGGGSSRRRSIFKDYKQKRRPEKLNRFYEDGEMPNTVENRNHQISILVEIMKNLPIIQAYVPDCEADDVIGYISKYRFKDSRKLIVSSDKDFYQLLDNFTIIYSPTWKKFITRKEVLEKFEISPENFCLAKSICGDPSDNIAGVDRVGFKTLSKRFPEFSQQSSISIPDIISKCKLMLSEGNNIKAIKNISESEALIKRNWSLIYLDTVNLAAHQITKINYILDNFEPDRKKMQVMRTLIREGIQTFNVDRLFLSLNHVGRT